MAKHRAERHTRRHAVPVVIPVQRQRRPIGIANARDQIEHLVTDESVAQHRHSGRYLAVCGTRVLAASLTAPERGRCARCIQVVSRA